MEAAVNRLVEKSELDRMYNSIEQLRTRIDTNFDIINSLLREVTSTLSSLNTQIPIQKEALDALKEFVKEIEARVSVLETTYAKAKGMTTAAKIVWGVVIAIGSFLLSNIGAIIRALHGVAGV